MFCFLASFSQVKCSSVAHSWDRVLALQYWGRALKDSAEKWKDTYSSNEVVN